jgi:hypothetical protein
MVGGLDRRCGLIEVVETVEAEAKYDDRPSHDNGPGEAKPHRPFRALLKSLIKNYLLT